MTQWRKQSALQVNQYMGVLRAPCGFQIEILPKIGKSMEHDEARRQLMKMLHYLPDFRHNGIRASVFLPGTMSFHKTGPKTA